MVDFRKLISPKTRAEITANTEALISFQRQSREDMAVILLASTRTLIDSGFYSDDQRRSYDEWGLYRVIPELARRLDPQIQLRETETPKEDEKADRVTWLGDADDARLIEMIQSIARNGSYHRSMGHGVPDEIDAITDFLFASSRVNAMKIAADTLVPGTYPDRADRDTRPPLPGQQVIASHESGYDKVLSYDDDSIASKASFDVAVKIAEGQDLDEEDEKIVRRMRDEMSEKVLQISIQVAETGEKLATHDVVRKAEVEAEIPSMA